MTDTVPEYGYHDAKPTWANTYLWPVVKTEARGLSNSQSRIRNAFDMGCENGATSDLLAKLGFDVTGVDLSQSGIELAKEAFSVCPVLDDILIALSTDDHPFRR